MPKFIFVAGGVMSGIGKGVTTASIGKILQSKGFRVTAIKIDPYINVDAGTMNPVEHGEVFVTKDGTECDQDVGNYERFISEELTTANYITTGRVYKSVIERERNLEYGGKCVEVVPHIPEEVISRIKKAAKITKADFVLIEIGGTVGEYQNSLFLEAARMMKIFQPNDILFILISYLPVPELIGEMKSKPTQQATKWLNMAGIQPDIIVARSVYPLDKPRKNKISIFCNVAKEDVISAPDIKSIYEIPINFEKDKIGERILRKFGLKIKRRGDLKDWRKLIKVIKTAKKTVKIGIVGKYFETGKFTLMDSYISVIEAVKHAAWSNSRKPEIHWLSAEKYEKDPKSLKELKDYDGIIVPGGFGSRGIEGKIKTIEFCRKNKIPFLGLCLGMQLSVIEFSRNVAKMKDASSAEFSKNCKYPVIDVMEEQKAVLKEKKYGGTMRLGDYNCKVKPDTLSFKAYSASGFKKDKKGFLLFPERHRHRYELNNNFRDKLESKGLIMAGINPEKDLVEIIELKNHPFFVATQFHPEFKSKPTKPHPLFREFIKACLK
ncbi:MAG: CTP synthase [Candidatus Nealsonbacteria bacterium]